MITPDLAGKMTEMFVEGLAEAELTELLASDDALRRRIDEAETVLRGATDAVYDHDSPARAPLRLGQHVDAEVLALQPTEAAANTDPKVKVQSKQKVSKKPTLADLCAAVAAPPPSLLGVPLPAYDDWSAADVRRVRTEETSVETTLGTDLSNSDSPALPEPVRRGVLVELPAAAVHETEDGGGVKDVSTLPV